ncbi:DUF3304 domain-containing protein [Salmonella enterica]|nr:DUF3304 domain-containing protein [Salmonella enterica]EBK3282594.1 DUF3304 domain-containing protein [Salmonella enterica]
MGFFTRLEQFDVKLIRWYQHWRKWVWCTLIMLPVIAVLWNIGEAVWGGPTGGVILVIHSEIDRPILGFSVNGVAGANAFAYGGGATTCCGEIKGKKAEVVWTLSTTRAQYNSGLRKEVRRKTLPLPKREWGEDWLHVYFLPGDQVLLGWSKGAGSPYKKRKGSSDKSRVQQEVQP